MTAKAHRNVWDSVIKTSKINVVRLTWHAKPFQDKTDGMKHNKRKKEHQVIEIFQNMAWALICTGTGCKRNIRDGFAPFHFIAFMFDIVFWFAINLKRLYLQSWTKVLGTASKYEELHEHRWEKLQQIKKVKKAMSSGKSYLFVCHFTHGWWWLSHRKWSARLSPMYMKKVALPSTCNNQFIDCL